MSIRKEDARGKERAIVGRMGGNPRKRGKDTHKLTDRDQ